MPTLVWCTTVIVMTLHHSPWKQAGPVLHEACQRRMQAFKLVRNDRAEIADLLELRV